MTVCKFFQQGNCRFGDNCKFEHPGGNRGQSSNRFGAFGTGGGTSGGSRGGTSNRSEQERIDKYNLSIEVIEKDLTSDRPQWILSSYGPGRDAPDQLFGGYPREQSFEELRLHYMMGKASGNEQQALSEAQSLYETANSQMQNALRNIKQAAVFIADGENRHPNRHDVCKEGTQGAPFGEFALSKRRQANQGSAANPFGSAAGGASSSPFGGGSTAAPASGSAFGQPSAMGQKPNPFASASQPAQAQQSSNPFASNAQPASGSAFGQPSALGAKPNPFGAPAFGQSAQPAQPAQPSAPQGNAFGQASQLGAKPNPFASEAAPGASPFAVAGGDQSNASGQPASNPFGANNNAGSGPSPFGSAANNNTTGNTTTPSPFGGQSNAAPSAFGAAASTQNAASSSPFGQPAQPSAAASDSPFGQPAAPNPFGSNANQTSQPSAFGQPATANPFGQQQNGPSAFGQPQQSKPNPFGQPASTANGTSAFANQSSSVAPATAGAGPYPPDSSKQHPPAESYINKGMDGRIAGFKGEKVTFNKDGKPGIQGYGGAWKRIWFPDGPPPYNKDTGLPTDNYDPKTKSQWDTFTQTGTFQDGLIPELPPPRECTTWDF